MLQSRRKLRRGEGIKGEKNKRKEKIGKEEKKRKDEEKGGGWEWKKRSQAGFEPRTHRV